MDVGSPLMDEEGADTDACDRSANTYDVLR